MKISSPKRHSGSVLAAAGPRGSRCLKRKNLVGKSAHSSLLKRRWLRRTWALPTGH